MVYPEQKELERWLSPFDLWRGHFVCTLWRVFKDIQPFSTCT